MSRVEVSSSLSLTHAIETASLETYAPWQRLIVRKLELGHIEVQSCGLKLLAPDFIFMLKRHDRVALDAQGWLSEALCAGVRHIGCEGMRLPVPCSTWW
jgi:hypothetical protein